MGNMYGTIHETYHTDSKGTVFKNETLTKSIRRNEYKKSKRYYITFPSDSKSGNPSVPMSYPSDRQKYYARCFKTAVAAKCDDILIDIQMLMNDYYILDNDGKYIPDPLYDPKRDCVINDAISSFGLKYKTITMPGQNIGWGFMMIKMNDSDLKITNAEIVADPKSIKSDYDIFKINQSVTNVVSN